MAWNFTIDEMNKAFDKYILGKPLTDKEMWLAESKATAIRSLMPRAKGKRARR
jgi:hypothetical protein